MKRAVTKFLTMCVFAALLCVAAYAEEIAATEFNGVALEDEMKGAATLTFYGADGNPDAPIAEDAKTPGRYFEAARGSVSYSAAQKGQRYVLMMTVSKLSPTRGLVDEELFFIREKAADSDTVTIDFYPRDMENDMQYYVYLSGSGSGSFRKLVATFTYKDYLLGDVSGNREITPEDSLFTLEMSARMQESYADWQEKAADVNRDGEVDPQDALYITEKAANPEMPFPGA